ncbi:sodium:solute symporter family protein [Tuberibacillus sp. Marseille-P3662]|uniref:sodium:solute symporter family protein n=1 Tax=Tuberibacillus sp. Marseille-P3662 TaxID=1965358 RepID=UPI000A1C89AD|nr:sodium:solute symporter family protein [Tuberibacillus sp. Marseille-P3662]
MDWTYLIPASYLVLMLIIGFVISKRQQSRSDFYVASNKMNSGILFATIFSTVVGANTYMGFSGQVYNFGFSRTWMLVAAGSAYFLLFFIVGKIRKIAQKHEVFTLPDLMELRYSKSVALWTTVFSLIGLIGGAGGSILGIGTILHSTIGININTAILVTSVVTIVYTAFGGLMGVAWTDWVQSIIMVGGLILVIIFGLQALDPETNMVHSVTHAAGALQDALGSHTLNFLEGATFFMVIGWWLTFLPLNTISQTQIQRVYAAKNEKIIQRISLLMIIFVGLFMSFSLALVGILGSSLMPQLDNPEAVFPMLALQVINPWIGMVIVTGIIGAAMSTVDSNLLGASIHVSRDLYERYKKGKSETINEKTGINLSRLSIVVIGGMGTIAAILTPSIMQLLLGTMHIFAGATFIPVLAGIYWKRANSNGAMSGILSGGIVTIIGEIMQWPHTVIIGIVFSLAGVIIGSLVTKMEPEKATLFQFKTMTQRDYPFFVAICLFFALFLIGLTQLALWPILITLAVIGLTIGLILMAVYALPDRKG